MNELIFWFVWIVLTGAGYIILLYISHLKGKGEQDRINRVKAEHPNLYTRVQIAIQKELENPKEEKDFRDLYVFDKDVEKLEQELERLKRWGIRNR